MKVLVACEFSGKVRESLRSLGHDAWSCDLVESWDHSAFHYREDVRNVLDNGWDLMIAHPPCTFLANSGNQWLKRIPKNKTKGNLYGQDRFNAMLEAVEFFNLLLNSNIPKIAVENPIMHRESRKRINSQYDQIIQPYEHGHGHQKATCLWLKNLPKLKPTNIVDGRFSAVHLGGTNKWVYKTSDRKMIQKLRSVTYDGIAKAMAEQWSI